MTRQRNQRTVAVYTRQNLDSRRRHGAAMIVVMLVLLMTTGTAVFAMRSAQYEMKTASNFTRRAQATTVADSSLTATFALVDTVTPQALIRSMRQTASLNATPLDLSKFEAPLAPGMTAHRLYPEDYIMYDDLTTTGVVEEFYDDTLIGAKNLYEPYYVVDIYDVHEFTGPSAGRRVDGKGNFKYVRMTYTSRGRLQLPTTVGSNNNMRRLHEVGSDSRGYAVSGPFSM